MLGGDTLAFGMRQARIVPPFHRVRHPIQQQAGDGDDDGGKEQVGQSEDRQSAQHVDGVVQPGIVGQPGLEQQDPYQPGQGEEPQDRADDAPPDDAADGGIGKLGDGADKGGYHRNHHKWFSWGI